MDQRENDPLSAASITQDLGTAIVGRKVLYYPRVTSTMEAARQEALAGAPEGTVVIADEQTAGRGRLRRNWFAPAGNIALSVVLNPRLSDLPSLVMLASLAVVQSIEAVTGIRCQIKWPNDVLVNGRKVCGILVETDIRKERLHHAIIGIGINVNLRPSDFPEIEPIATSLSAVLGREVSRPELVRSLLRRMDSLYAEVRQGNPLYEEWRDRLVTLGQRVRVKSDEGVREGVAESVEPDGSLLLRGSDGQLTRILAGDVTLLKE